MVMSETETETGEAGDAAPATESKATPPQDDAPIHALATRPKRIGIIAGAGRFPILLAEALKADGHEVVILGVSGAGDPGLARLADRFHWCGVAQIGKAARLFRRENVTVALMAGKVEKKAMYSRFRLLKFRPDWSFLKVWYRRVRDRKDDTLLGAISQFFEDEGIHIEASALYLKDALAPIGPITRRRPSESEERDVAFGFRLAKELGRLDCGQSVCVKEQAVIALEAIEGTDLCIKRAGELCPKKGFTVVKVAKPNQDMRFDVPTIGTTTIRTIAEAGGRCLAVEAGVTLFLDAEDAIAAADEAGIAIVGVRRGPDDGLVTTGDDPAGTTA